MSIQQAEIDEFDRSKRPARGGYQECDRPKCGFEMKDHGECGNPVVLIASIDYCTQHLEHAFDDEDGPDSDKPVWDRADIGGRNE